MANQAKQEAEKIKLLLLGAGESGKSTIFKYIELSNPNRVYAMNKEQISPTSI